MDVWLQRHDFQSEDLPDGSFEAANRRLVEFDWEEELRRYESASQEGRDCCPPGMGFIDRGCILHLMPEAGGRYSNFMYTYPKKKLLGLIPLSGQITVAEVPNEQREAIIRRHYDGDHEAVREALEKHGTLA